MLPFFHCTFGPTVPQMSLHVFFIYFHLKQVFLLFPLCCDLLTVIIGGPYYLVYTCTHFTCACTCTLPANDKPSGWPADPHQNDKEADSSSRTIRWRGCLGWRDKSSDMTAMEGSRAWQEDNRNSKGGLQWGWGDADGAELSWFSPCC